MDRSAWKHRSAEFHALRVLDEAGKPVVAMELELRCADELLASWLSLRELWLRLPSHPNALRAVAPGNASSLYVRYAALDWKHAFPVPIARPEAMEIGAIWGAQLSHAFDTIAINVEERELGHLARPFVKIDVGRNVRVGFLPIVPGELATTSFMGPEMIQGWPRCDERGLVFVVGKLVEQLCDIRDAPDLMAVLRRATDRAPLERYKSLSELRDAFIQLFPPAREAVRHGADLAAWQHAEAAAGFLAIHQPERARVAAEASIDEQLGTKLAHDVRYQALVQMLEPRVPYRRTGKSTAPLRVSWTEAATRGRQLELDRAFRDALALYQSAIGGSDDVDRFEALARCSLAVGDHGPAVDYAARALAIEPSRLTVHEILIRGLLSRGASLDALQATDVATSLAPDDAVMHYLRGRALLAAGRLRESREELERALVLRPTLVEAMLIRREVDRCSALLRQTVGEAPTIALRDYLADLKGDLAAGQTERLIERLAGADYADDPAAQLVLASCLEREKRFDEALSIYDRITSTEHRATALAGKASTLLAAGRADDALATLAAADPDDPDVLECRIRILERLGRADEVAATLARFIAIAATRSDLRVRAAQLSTSSSGETKR